MLKTAGVTVENLGQHSLQALRVENEFCSALIALQGAQVVEFTQKQTQKPLLWCSELNSYQQGKPFVAVYHFVFRGSERTLYMQITLHTGLPATCRGNG